MHPILDHLAFGHALEEQARALTRGVDARERRTLTLGRQRAIELVPGREPLGWRRYDVPQHLAPEASHALGFRAVERDLDLPDRRHRYTIVLRRAVVRV